MSSVQPVRGTRDLLPDENRRHRHVVNIARHVAELYGYHEMATPIFEFTEVFQRTLGETSDVVTKEMYTFEDRGGDRITLRPEATAAVARALISGGLMNELPLKYFVSGPMFRYERPQKGRFRQFQQIDIELLGVAEPAADIEVIAVGAHILEALGILDETRLELNTLGDQESRKAYRGALVDFLSGYRDDLSEESRNRLERNPLRILDSKDDGDKEIIADAPLFTEYLNALSRDFFAGVCNGLDELDIAYTPNPRVVRGLDYYCHTAFEFKTTALGAQDAVLAGGRYDGLVRTLGGPDVPAVGWAGGVERLSMLCRVELEPPRPVAIIPIGAAADATARLLAHQLRHAGHIVELGYRGNLSRRLRRANKLGAKLAVLLGEDELARAAATVRDLDSGEQTEVSIDSIEDYLTRNS